jgi:hypothetical protein
MRWTVPPSSYVNWKVASVIVSLVFGFVVTIYPDGKANSPLLGLFLTVCGVLIGQKYVARFVEYPEYIFISDRCLELHFVYMLRRISLSDIKCFQLWIYGDDDGSDQLKAMTVALNDGSILRIPKREGLQIFVREASRQFGITIRELRDSTKWAGG